MPSVTTDVPSGATLTRTVESGTCFSGMRIFKVARFSYLLLIPLVPEGERDDREGDDEHHEREGDREDGLAVGEIHQFSILPATSSRTSTGRICSCTPLAPTPSSSVIRQNGHPLATLVAPLLIARSCSIRRWFTRWPTFSSIHMRPPPAPQQNPRSRLCGSISTRWTPGIASRTARCWS